MTIRVEHLVKTFTDPSRASGSFRAVDDVSFEIAERSLTALLGPSGGGKSTVLRMIAGLESPDVGSIWLDGVRVDGVHARDRRVGLVFQHFALFKHMSVRDNVAFGLIARGTEKRDAHAEADALLALVGLDGHGDRRPSDLSGGQRQRVALARALAPKPRVLLLDEPFSAVDARVREDLRHWLRRFHDEHGVTTIFVTHDQEEAFQLADRVVVIHKGRVEQEGPPVSLIDRPESEFIARFVGDVNVIDATVIGGHAQRRGFTIAAPSHADGSAVRVIVRANDLKLRPDPIGIARVKRTVILGDRVRVEAELDDGAPLIAYTPRFMESDASPLVPGQRVACSAARARVYASGA